MYFKIQEAKRNNEKINIDGNNLDVSLINVEGVNKTGEGALIILDSNQFFYIEKLMFFNEFKETLDSLKDLCDQLQSNIGTAPSGGGTVAVDPGLIEKTVTLNTCIDKLVKKLP
jgi:hypothetical protein